MSTLLGWSPLILMVILGLIIFFIYRLVSKNNRQVSQPTSNLESRVARLEEENRLLKEESNRER